MSWGCGECQEPATQGDVMGGSPLRNIRSRWPQTQRREASWGRARLPGSWAWSTLVGAGCPSGDTPNPSTSTVWGRGAREFAQRAAQAESKGGRAQGRSHRAGSCPFVSRSLQGGRGAAGGPRGLGGAEGPGSVCWGHSVFVQEPGPCSRPGQGPPTPQIPPRRMFFQGPAEQTAFGRWPGGLAGTDPVPPRAGAAFPPDTQPARPALPFSGL